MEWASGQRRVLKRWYCRLGEKILSTHLIRRMDSRWHLCSSSSRCKTSHTKPIPLQITTATNFQKAPREKAPTTSTFSRCPSTVAMLSKIIMCRTASVYEKVILNHSHHQCLASAKTLMRIRTIQATTHQQSDNSWKETWRTSRISSRRIRATRLLQIHTLDRDQILCRIRPIWTD